MSLAELEPDLETEHDNDRDTNPPAGQQPRRTTMTVGNRTFTTDLTAPQASARLVELVDDGTIKNTFAIDLARQIRQRGWVSPNQLRWVQKFVADVDQPVIRSVNGDSLATGPAGGMAKIVEHFARAADTLKRPKIVVTDPETDVTICMKPAGPRSKYFGSIIVTSGKSFDATYYGHIRSDGTFLPAGRASDDFRDAVGLLERIAVDPAGELGRLGKLSGQCCFCQRPLTDDRSTNVGYGPVCAKRWGLPWGVPGSAASGSEGGAE